MVCSSDELFSLKFEGAAVVADDGRQVSYAELRTMTQAGDKILSSLHQKLRRGA